MWSPLPLKFFHSSGGVDMTDSIFHILQGDALIHSRRDYAFITCTTPVRKFEIAYPEPESVYLRQMNITNLDTEGLTHVYEFEDKEIFGWSFPVVANSRIEVRPNLPGLDLSEAAIRYAFSDLLALKEADALRAASIPEPEWFQLVVASWSKWNHYKLTYPDYEMVGTRRGPLAAAAAKSSAKLKPYLTDPTQLATSPSTLQSMTHGMIDEEHWAVVFKFPLPSDALSWNQEPLCARFEARRCADEGCTLGLGDEIPDNWTNPISWSDFFASDLGLEDDIGDVVRVRRLATAWDGLSLSIPADTWVVFDVSEPVALKNLTIFGKLSFDDSADRTLEADSITVWGLLEIGSELEPFGASTGSKARVRLRGSVLDTETYVYIEEETLHNKVIAVPGRLETYGAPLTSTWLRLNGSLDVGATSACVMQDSSGTVDWPAGSEVAIAPTEFDDPAGHVERRILTANAAWNSSRSCWLLEWSEGLARTHYSGEFEVGNGRTVALRSVIARIDRSVVFESVSVDGSGTLRFSTCPQQAL